MCLCDAVQIEMMCLCDAVQIRMMCLCDAVQITKMVVFVWCCADQDDGVCMMLCRSRRWRLCDAVQIKMMCFCDAVQIKEMMENARRELQERKAQLGIQTTPKPTAPAQPPPSSAAPPPRVRLLCQHTSLCVKALEFWGEKVTSFQALGSSLRHRTWKSLKIEIMLLW